MFTPPVIYLSPFRLYLIYIVPHILYSRYVTLACIPQLWLHFAYDAYEK